jgi:hypothetical protein
MARFFSYIRFSSAAQEEGDSERRQLENASRRAAETKAEFVDAYTDRGMSGWTGKNRDGALGEMISDVASGKIRAGDIISVENHDRLTRRPPLEAIQQFIGFLNAGIILDINGQLRSREILNQPTGFGLLVMDLIEMFRAYQESQRKSELGLATNAAKRKAVQAGERKIMKAGKGGFVGHRCPSWLRPLSAPSPEGYLYEIVPDEDGPWRQIARSVFRMADNGHGCPTISRRLNASATPSLETARRVDGHTGKWTAASVYQLLRNRAVIGEYQPYLVKDGKRTQACEAVQGYYPPLFPDDPGIFHRIGTALPKRDRAGGRGRKGKTFINIVTGLGHCEACGGGLVLHSTSGKMRADGGREFVYSLRCANAKHGVILDNGQKCPNGRGFPYPTFETALFGLFSPSMIPVLAQLMPQRQRNEVLARRISECEAKIGEADKRMTRFVALIANADDDEIAMQYDAQLKRIKAGRDKVRVELDDLRQQQSAGDDNHEEQIAAILATLNDVANPTDRYDARVKLHKALTAYITVTLTRDRSMAVRIAAHSGLNPLVAKITTAGLDMLTLNDPEAGILLTYAGEAAGIVAADPDRDRRVDEIKSVVSAARTAADPDGIIDAIKPVIVADNQRRVKAASFTVLKRSTG